MSLATQIQADAAALTVAVADVIAIPASVAAGLNRSSTTTLTPEAGSKEFTFTAASSYTPWGVGSRVRAASEASPATVWMSGIVTAESTEAVTIEVDDFAGAEASDWTLALGGKDGDGGWSPVLGVVGYSRIPAAEIYYNGTGIGTFSTTSLAADLFITAGMVIKANADIETGPIDAIDSYDVYTSANQLLNGSPATVDLILIGEGEAGQRRVHQVTDWVGGEGTKPQINQYVGVVGLVDNIEDAVDIRGSAGADGAAGTNGSDGADGSNGSNAQMTRASTTSLVIGMGSKSFTFTATATNLGWLVGARLRAVSAANAANFMEGAVTTVSTTSVAINVDVTGGSGTLADWNIVVSGGGGTQPIALGGTGAITAAAAFAAIKQAASDTSTGAIELATRSEVFAAVATALAVTPIELMFLLMSPCLRRIPQGAWATAITGGASTPSQHVWGVQANIFSTGTLTAGVTISGSPIVTVTSTTGVIAGVGITGTGIPASTTVLTVDSGTQLTLSANATAANTGLSFTYGIAATSLLRLSTNNAAILGAFSRTKNRNAIDFAKLVWFSGRMYFDSAWTPADTTYRMTFGKSATTGIGDLSRLSFGWKRVGLAALVALGHNGTTQTPTTSSFTPTLDQNFDWDVISYGTGTVELFINGISVGTTTGGPTATLTDATNGITPQIEMEKSGASTSAAIGYFINGSIFVAP